MPTKTAILAECNELLHRNSFSKEDSARIDGLLRFADKLSDDRGEPGQRRELDARLPHNAEFSAYLSLGRDGLTVDRRADIARKMQGALGVGTDSAGGYLAPQPFADRVTDLLVQYDQLFDVAQVYLTNTGRACGFPLSDDAAVGAAIVSESGSSNQSADAVFGNIAFSACPTWRTGLIRASVELTQDSAFDFQGLLARAFARRFAKGIGAAFVTKLLTSATAGVTAASTTAIAPGEIHDLVSSVDDAYSSNPQTGFLMRRSTLTAIRKLVGTSGNFMFEAERDADGNPLLLGYRVYISPATGDLTASAKPILFGDLSMFIRRSVKDSLVVKSYVERFAEFGQCALEGFWRMDGDLAKSSSVVPIKYLAMHA
jgi:HK97 family phage major capsid protein